MKNKISELNLGEIAIPIKFERIVSLQKFSIERNKYYIL